MTSRTIPSLDGLRALSIALVLFDHGYASAPSWLQRVPGVWMLRNGGLGVGFFFVISGFLITRLLLNEEEKTGSISLRRFYFRRAMRIFPPFYVYMLVLGILWAASRIYEQPASFIAAVTYTWNYRSTAVGWYLAHTWSLSLEEQFYLVWPACLLLLGLTKSRPFAVAVILLSPVSRVVTYYLAPTLRGHLGMMLHTRLDTLMFGCLLALLCDNLRFQQLADRILRPWVILLAGWFVLYADPNLESRFAGRYTLPFGISLEGFLASAILLYAVRKPESIFGSFLNSRVVRHVGIISYSIYLWQQLFMTPNFGHFFLALLIVFACAELSYWVVERPALRLRDALEGRPFIAAISREAA